MIYYSCIMKKLIHPALIFTTIIFLVTSCAMIAFSAKRPTPNNTTGAALFLQTTSTPPVEKDKSEVGSTDGIIIMGGVIAAIVLIPLLLQRKAWTRGDDS